jgi:hypothetical protein
LPFFYNKQVLKLYCLPLEYGTQKTVSAHQNLPGLRPPFCLAKKMGESLGRGEVLQRQVQGAGKKERSNRPHQMNVKIKIECVNRSSFSFIPTDHPYPALFA